MPSAPLAWGVQQQGLISHTAARQQAARGGAPPATAQADLGAQHYYLDAPVSPLAQCAERVRLLLEKAVENQERDPWWAIRFWRAVALEEANGILEAPVLGLLRRHGYVGVGTRASPGAEELKTALAQLIAGTVTPLPLEPGVSDYDRWATSLAPDVRRAAPEIFKNMRQAGAPSARQWLSESFTASRKSPGWLDLWAAASSVDFLLGGATTDSARFTLRSTNDVLEVHLRHIAAYIYEQRTGDGQGAQRIRAVVAPGSGADVAPSWLIQEATLLGKQEHQRSERVAAELKRRQGGGGGQFDHDGGKGKKGKKGKHKDQGKGQQGS